jgi:hypothetical protein
VDEVEDEGEEGGRLAIDMVVAAMRMVMAAEAEEEEVAGRLDYYFPRVNVTCDKLDKQTCVSLTCLVFRIVVKEAIVLKGKHMPRRANLAVAIQEPSAPQQDTQAENLAILRTQWRWAAFTQFFFTFAPLFALNDVSVSVCNHIIANWPGFIQSLPMQDIEQDLVCNTRLVLPRIMQKLLFSLSYDRKVSYVYPPM